MFNEESNRLSRRDLLKAAPIAVVGVAAATSSPLWLPPSAASAEEELVIWGRVLGSSQADYAPTEVFSFGDRMESFDYQRTQGTETKKWQSSLIKSSGNANVLWAHLPKDHLQNTSTDVPDHSDYDIVVHGPKDARYELSTMDRYGDHGRNLYEANRPSLPNSGVPGGPAGHISMGLLFTTHNLQLQRYTTGFRTWMVVDFYDPHTYTWRRRVLNDFAEMDTFQAAFIAAQTAVTNLRGTTGLTATATSLVHALAAHSLFNASPVYDVAAIAAATVAGYYYWRNLQAALAVVAPSFDADDERVYDSNATDNVPTWPV